MEKIIANKYRIDQLIAKGCFGAVFKGYLIGTNEPVAIKIETSNQLNSLKHETKILNYLYSNKVRKIPAIYWYGQYGDSPCLIITYYDYSLADYIKKRISIKKTGENPNKIIASMIDILSYIHKNFIIHRDLKPENFMIKNNEIYLIDFGLSTFYISDGSEHLPNKSSQTIIGSPRWISKYILEGNSNSRRDDLISIGYIFAYLVLEKTPWEITQSITNDIINTAVNIDGLNINHPINIWRKENRSIDMFKKWLEEDSLVYNYLNSVYEYEYSDTPKYDELINMILSTC